MLCPCHSQKSYQECCQKFHAGQNPESALQLMRSRYSAYALGLVEYIIDTTHKQCPEFQIDRARWKKDIQEFSKTTRFEGLKILETYQDKKQATVTFQATLIQGSVDVSFCEKSYFLKQDGLWIYLKGEIFSG